MNNHYYQVSLIVFTLLVSALSRGPWRSRLTEHIIYFAAAVFAFTALLADSGDEFWRLMTASLVAIGFGLEISAAPWSGKARLRLALLFPVMIFTGSIAMSSSLLSGTVVSHLSISFFVLAVLSDTTLIFRKGSEETSAHPLRALRLLIIGILSAFYAQNFLPTSLSTEDGQFWRWTLTGLGAVLMVMSFLNRNPRKRQVIMVAWLGLLSFWGVLSLVKTNALIGIVAAAAGALALVCAGDESVPASDMRSKVLKLGINVVPGTALFSVFALFVINRQEGDGPQLAIWLGALCLHWFAVARDAWDWNSEGGKTWSVKHRIALFTVIAASCLLLLGPELSTIVELLQ